eukprot:Ihof_evm7s103 gene=Ihof_evmTU7s103
MSVVEEQVPWDKEDPSPLYTALSFDENSEGNMTPNKARASDMNSNLRNRMHGFDTQPPEAIAQKATSPIVVSFPKKPALTKQDKMNVALLVLLYLLQGIPIGLAFGSVPFLLKQKFSYTIIGIFSLAQYPY